MSSGYEWYLEKRRKVIESTKAEVKRTNKEASGTIFPQYVLLWKEVCSELEDEESKCVTIDGNFYFTERLVNKLMLFSSIMSTKCINEDSYQRGWEDCWADVQTKLGISGDNT